MRCFKTCSKLLMVMILSFFMSIPISFAREMTIDDLEEELEKREGDIESVYIIGNYVFTSDYYDKMDLPDFMLSSTSIDVSDINGKVKDDFIYKEMTIFQLNRPMDDNGERNKLVSTNNLVGLTNLPGTLNVKYIDYDFLKELYKVTFNADNGEENKVVKVEDGSTVAMPDTPVKEGFYFDGWYKDGAKYEFTTPITEDITLTAKWLEVEDVDNDTEDILGDLSSDYYEADRTEGKITINMLNGRLKLSEVTDESNVFVALTSLLNNKGVSKVTISYPGVDALELTGNGVGDVATNTAKTTMWLQTNMNTIAGKTYDDVLQRDLVGKKFTVTIDLKDGYVTNSGDTTVTYTIDFTAVVKYDVTFDYNDDGVTDSKKVQILENDTIESIENPTREHYDFVGWYKGEEKFEVNTPITEDITLKAHWKGKTYTATFKGEGIDTSKYPAQSVEYPNLITEPEEEPTMDGHSFTGWFVGETEFNFSEPLTGNVEIKAVWDVNKYTVEFFDDEETSISKETVKHGSTLTAPEAANKKGYNLTWKKDSTSGEDYDLNTPVTGELKLYASYEPFKYTIKFAGDDINNGEENVIPDQELTYPTKASRPTDPKREGYTFDDWYLDSEEEPFDFNEEILAEGEITLTAKWTANVYHVKYECEECKGNLPLDQDYTYPNKPAQPTLNPSKTGYDFLYWYDKDSEDQTEYDFANTKLLKDLTLVAKFDAHKQNVKFQVCDPTDKTCVAESITNVPDTLRVEYGTKATEPTQKPEREGYDFLYWFDINPPFTQAPFDFNNTNIIRDYTLRAKWEKKTYNITFKVDDNVLETLNGVPHGTTINEALKSANKTLSPYKESYRFDHWYLETEEDTTEYSFSTPVTSNLTLKAKMIPQVDIDNIVSDMALKIKSDIFAASYLNRTLVFDISEGGDDHSDAHNDDKVKDIVESGNTGIVTSIKGVVDNENVSSVKIHYGETDYEFTGTEENIKSKLVELLTAIATTNGSTYDNATLNELIENNYSNNPLTLTITLKDGAETVEGQSSPATYNVKVSSDVYTVTNETELNLALQANYETIKIGNSFEVENPVLIGRSVSIFGKESDNTITIKNNDADAVFDVRYNTVAKETTVNLKNLTLKGGKKGIRVPEKSTSLSIYNVSFVDNSDMAMEISGKLHADGTLSYNKEDYNHPFIRTLRSNVITGVVATSAKETGNVEVHNAYVTYDYKIIVPYGGIKYTEDDFKEHTWGTNGWKIGESWCDGCTGDNGSLKPEYLALIGQDNTAMSDTLSGTSWAHYYLDKKNSQYYSINFIDTPSAARTLRYVLYGGDPVEPGEPLPWYAFKSYAKKRAIGSDDNKKTYELQGWSNVSKSQQKDYDFDIKDVTQGKIYYTYYVEVTE